MKLANIKKQIASQLDNVTDSSVEFYKDLLLALASNPEFIKYYCRSDIDDNQENAINIINQADAIIKQLESEIKKEK